MARASLNSRPRVRATLLVLLWFWAATMFLVVDLFFNVPEFDRVRPRAPLYRAAREVAHEMVGEPIRGEGALAPARAGPGAPATARAHAAPRLMDPHALARPSSRHAGGRPDLRTPQGRRLFEQLREAAETADDARRREGARRSLEAMFGMPIEGGLGGRGSK